MNRNLLKTVIPAVAVAGVLAMSTMARAQTAPPPAPANPPGDRKMDGPGADHGDHADGPRDGDRGPGDHGPGDRGPDDRGPGNDRRPPRPDQADGKQGIPPEMARFQGYLTMVTQYGKLASDPEASGVAAVVSAADVLRKGGPQEAINFFVKILPDVKQDAVRRAIRLQLVDLYKAANQPDKALEQLSNLITADGASASESTKK